MYPQINKARDLIKLDGFWSFKDDRHDEGEDQHWYMGLRGGREIAVPGSWNEQYSDLFDFMGKGWYETRIFIPCNWKSRDIWIQAGSVCTNAKVWINGCYAGEHEGAHLPFEFKITDIAIPGEYNTITILADATLDHWGLPPANLELSDARVGFFNSHPSVTYDFFPYGGIHRPVFLYATSKCRVEDITISTDIDGNNGIVNYEVILSEEFIGTIEVFTGNKSQKHLLENARQVQGTLRIQNAGFWEPGNPFLYDLTVNVFTETELIDCYTQAYGIRTVEVKDGKFLLNGKEVFFKGFGKHEDFHIIGKGLNHCLIVRDFDLLKWVGANSFRTSHYPYAEDLMDYANRHGMLVIDETPFVGLNDRMYTKKILERAKKVIHELIARDKNHPSVVMWSLANEPNIYTSEGEWFFKEMAETARSLDSTRPITYVGHLLPENNAGMKYYDVICINKYFGWYEGPGRIDDTLPSFENCLDSFYNTFNKPLILTEFGADAIAGMHTDPPQMFSEEFQAEMLEKQYNLLRAKEYCIGAHVWAFADFKTAQSISRIIFNRKGVFTRERQPKLAAHMLKRLWAD